MSIMQGFDEVVDKALKIRHIGTPPHYGHKSSAQELAARPSSFDAARMLREAFEVLHSNHAKAPRLAEKEGVEKGPSEENWRWKPLPNISANNNSLEWTLEKKIIELPGHDWVNQVPTASGLWNSNADKHRNVDLAHRVGDSVFELIELKIESDNPLKAAIEILQYGLLYLLAREFYPPDRLTWSPSLQAHEIRLRVLARPSYYSRMSLGRH